MKRDVILHFPLRLPRSELTKIFILRFKRLCFLMKFIVVDLLFY